MYVAFPDVRSSRAQCRAEGTAGVFGTHHRLRDVPPDRFAPAGAAMAQLKAKQYADKYRASGQPIYLMGVEFSKESRNLAAFDVERA